MLDVDAILTTTGKHPDRPIKYPPTKEMLASAKILADKANRLMADFGQHRKLNSGYRPPEINAVTAGSAAKSHHMFCRAIDIEDSDRKLSKFCLQHLDLLAELGLWLEDPAYTPTWVHVQIVQPGSGKRVFKPR